MERPTRIKREGMKRSWMEETDANLSHLRQSMHCLPRSWIHGIIDERSWMNTVVRCTYVYSNCHCTYGVDVYEPVMDEYVLTLDEWYPYTYAVGICLWNSLASMNMGRWVILYYVFQFILLQIHIPAGINKLWIGVHTLPLVQLLASLPVPYFQFQMATKISLFLAMTFICAYNFSTFIYYEDSLMPMNASHNLFLTYYFVAFK
jgi:hypothetical protein